MEWFNGFEDLFSLLQVLLDMCLIGVMIFLLKKRSRDLLQADEVAGSIKKIFEETQALAEGFDANLRERQVLIRQFLEKLDLQVHHARTLKNELETLKDEIAQSPITVSQTNKGTSKHSEQRLIYQLAQQGLAPKTIAQRLRKPLGEVELVLNLRDLASKG